MCVADFLSCKHVYLKLTVMNGFYFLTMFLKFIVCHVLCRDTFSSMGDFSLFCECDWLCLLISEGPPGTYNKTQNSEGQIGRAHV